MKLHLIVFFLFGSSTLAVTATAQSKTNSPGWPVSKGVSQYSNKSLADFKPLKLEVRGTPSFVQSKRVSTKSETIEGNVKSKGTPDWVISKPVNLISK
jgi:hypothetical protein